jgi:transposase
VQGLEECALERRLLVAPEQPRDHVQPDYGRLHQELRRKGMTLMLLWEEHRADYTDVQTYSYSRFCENYRRFAKQLKHSMRQVHRKHLISTVIDFAVLMRCLPKFALTVI